MLTQRERIAQCENIDTEFDVLNEHGITETVTSRKLLVGLCDALEDALAYPTDRLPQDLRGQGKTTSLARIAKGANVQTEKTLDEIRREEREEFGVKYAAEFDEKKPGKNEPGITFDDVNQDLIDDAYARFERRINRQLLKMGLIQTRGDGFCLD